MEGISDEVLEVARNLFDGGDIDYDIDRYGKATVNTEELPDLDDYEYTYGTTRAEILQQAIDLIVKILPNVTFYNDYNDTGVYLELSDNHTFWDINEPEGFDGEFDYDLYNFFVEQAFDEFENKTGVEAYQCGRSGRHICVKVNFDNILNYDKLCLVQAELEQQVIGEAESNCFGQALEEAKDLAPDEKIAKCLSCGMKIKYKNRDVQHDAMGDYIECPNCHSTFDVDYDNTPTKKTEDLSPAEEIDLADDINTYLMKNQLYPVDVFAADTRVMVEIEWGDWKHDHLRCDALMKAKGYTLVEEEVTEEDGSDCFSAIRHYEPKDKFKDIKTEAEAEDYSTFTPTNKVLSGNKGLSEKEIDEIRGSLPNLFKDMTDEQKQIWKELSLRGMVMSCLVYGDDIHTSTVINAVSKYYKQPYVNEYYDTLGKDVTEEIIKQQTDYFNRGKVIKDVGTDSDGLSYNSFVEPKDESKKVTEAEDMTQVKDDIETAVEKSDSTDLEKDQVKGSIDVLKTDEESAIEGYEDFKDETEKVADKELADAVNDQMEEIVDDEKEHIEKLDTIKSALGESKSIELCTDGSCLAKSDDGKVFRIKYEDEVDEPYYTIECEDKDGNIIEVYGFDTVYNSADEAEKAFKSMLNDKDTYNKLLKSLLGESKEARLTGDETYVAKNSSGYKSIGLIVNNETKQFQIINGQVMTTDSKTKKMSKKQIRAKAQQLYDNGYTEYAGYGSVAQGVEKKTEEANNYYMTIQARLTECDKEKDIMTVINKMGDKNLARELYDKYKELKRNPSNLLDDIVYELVKYLDTKITSNKNVKTEGTTSSEFNLYIKPEELSDVNISSLLFDSDTTIATYKEGNYELSLMVRGSIKIWDNETGYCYKNYQSFPVDLQSLIRSGALKLGDDTNKYTVDMNNWFEWFLDVADSGDVVDNVWNDVADIEGMLNKATPEENETELEIIMKDLFDDIVGQLNESKEVKTESAITRKDNWSDDYIKDDLLKTKKDDNLWDAFTKFFRGYKGYADWSDDEIDFSMNEDDVNQFIEFLNKDNKELPFKIPSDDEIKELHTCPNCGEEFAGLVAVDTADIDVANGENPNEEYYECPECGYRQTYKAWGFRNESKEVKTETVKIMAYGKLYYEYSNDEWNSKSEDEKDATIIDVADQATEEEGHTVNEDEVEVITENRKITEAKDDLESIKNLIVYEKTQDIFEELYHNKHLDCEYNGSNGVVKITSVDEQTFNIIDKVMVDKLHYSKLSNYVYELNEGPIYRDIKGGFDFKGYSYKVDVKFSLNGKDTVVGTVSISEIDVKKENKNLTEDITSKDVDEIFSKYAETPVTVKNLKQKWASASDEMHGVIAGGWSAIITGNNFKIKVVNSLKLSGYKISGENLEEAEKAARKIYINATDIGYNTGLYESKEVKTEKMGKDADKKYSNLYKYKGKAFAYDNENAIVEYVYVDPEDNSWIVLDEIGLSNDNWDNKEARDEYLDEYIAQLDDEANRLADDFIANEYLGESLANRYVKTETKAEDEKLAMEPDLMESLTKSLENKLDFTEADLDILKLMYKRLDNLVNDVYDNRNADDIDVKISTILKKADVKVNSLPYVTTVNEGFNLALAVRGVVGKFLESKFGYDFYYESKSIKTEANGGTATLDAHTDLLPIINMYQYDLYNMCDDLVPPPDADMSKDVDEAMLDIAEPIIETEIKDVLPSAQITFKEYKHPQYYRAFSNLNDVLYFDITYNVAEYEALKEKALQDPEFEKYLKDHYTSYDGFMSFFANNISEFNDQEDWKQFVSVLSYYLPNDDEANYNTLLYDTYDKLLEMGYEHVDSIVDGLVDNITDRANDGEMTINKDTVTQYIKELYGDVDQYDYILDGVLNGLSLSESKKVTEAEVTTATKSAGEYWVGDPCYVVPDNIYQGIWGDKYKFKDGTIDCGNGLSFQVHGTAWGDGEYKGSNGFIYGVDAGVLAIVPMELAIKERGLDKGTRHKSSTAKLEYKDGVFKMIFDNETITIDTDPSEDLDESKQLKKEDYEVRQDYYDPETGEAVRNEYVMSFDTWEEAQRFADGLAQDPNCTAWVNDTSKDESKKIEDKELLTENDEIPVVNPDEQDYYNNKGYIISLYPRSRSIFSII